MEYIFALVGDTIIWEENSVKLLGIFIDSNLSFNQNDDNCKKSFVKTYCTLENGEQTPMPAA